MGPKPKDVPVPTADDIKEPRPLLPDNVSDIATGEVCWALYPQAAALGEVELVATCRP